LNIDARPSDALAVAVRAHVQILVARPVMEAAGILPEEDLQEQAVDQGQPSAEPEAEESTRDSPYSRTSWKAWIWIRPKMTKKTRIRANRLRPLIHTPGSARLEPVSPVFHPNPMTNILFSKRPSPPDRRLYPTAARLRKLWSGQF